MAAGMTYFPIATTTLGTSTATVTFSTISGSYTDLVLVISVINAASNDDLYLEFNADTGSNYSKTQLFGNGSTAGSNQNSNATTYNGAGFFGTTISSSINQIMNYSNSTTFKTILTRANNSAGNVGVNIGLWRDTNAITSIKVGFGATNMAADTTLTLYGIAAA